MKRINHLLALFLLVFSTSAIAVDPVTGLISDSHLTDTAENNPDIRFSWDVSSDMTVIGYAFVLDTEPQTLPPAVPLGDQNVNSVTLSTNTLSGDGTYYFHIRAVNNEGQGSAPVHLGPFIIDTQAPSANASPSGGNFDAPQNVELSANESGKIFFTTDGSVPTTDSPEYASAISVQSDITITFLPQDVAGNLGTIVTENYVLSGVMADMTAPFSSASPAGGTYDTVQEVRLSANEAATIYFTVDGSMPTLSSSVYRQPLSVTADTTLRFFAVDQSNNQESAVNSEDYAIRSTVRNALGISNLGAALDINAHIAPFVSGSSGVLGNNIDVPNSDVVVVRTMVEPDTTHVGMSADMLLVAIYTVNDVASIFMREGDANWQLWDGLASSLASAGRIESLLVRQNLNVVQGPVSVLLPGSLIIYAGYRLDDGSLVFNGLEPIRFVIN
ncbi:MAG: chitobiase/beta-hexosaminidase C-terminal domain-containing protein [Pseudomonadota bacterium]